MDQKENATRFQRWAGLGGLSITLLFFTGLIALEAAGCQFLFTPDQGPPGYAGIILPVNALGFALIGMLITWYRPSNRIGWLALLFGFINMLNAFSLGFGRCVQAGILDMPGREFALSVVNFSGWALLLTLGFFLMIFPDGKFLSSRWRWMSVTLAALFGMYIVIVSMTRVVESVNQVVQPIFIFPLLGILSLVLRWRGSKGDVRQQIKWLTFFMATAGTLFFGVEVYATEVKPDSTGWFGWFYLLDLTLFILGFPLVFGLAIFKYRLYEIDIIIRRTLQYSLLTGILALIYLGGIVTLQGILDPLTGEHNSPLITVITTLGIVALFNPLRIRIQEIIDRRFYRRKYDAEQTLARFAAAARDEVDLEKLSTALLDVVDETMQPERVDLFLKREMKN